MSKENEATSVARVHFVRKTLDSVPDPHSAKVFHDACRAGATASEMNTLLAILKRDRQTLRELAWIESTARYLRNSILTTGIRPVVALKINRALKALTEAIP